MATHHTPQTPHLIINATRSSFALGLKEVWQYRDLLYFFSWREVKVRYRQTVLGVAWAVLQPLLTMVVFTIFFGGLAQIPSDGIPYPIFSFTALVPWTFFSTGVQNATNSLLTNAPMLKKIYFPRLIVPFSSFVSAFVDFFIAFGVLFVMVLAFASLAPTPLIQHIWEYQAVWETIPYGIQLSSRLLWIPLLFVMMVFASLGIGIWLSALNVQFRDVRQAIGFILRLWMFITPVVYPTSLLSPNWQLIYALNPMTGIIEGFRWALLGTQSDVFPLMGVSLIVSSLLLVTSLFYFQAVERKIADVV